VCKGGIATKVSGNPADISQDPWCLLRCSKTGEGTKPARGLRPEKKSGGRFHKGMEKAFWAGLRKKPWETAKGIMESSVGTNKK